MSLADSTPSVSPKSSNQHSMPCCTPHTPFFTHAIHPRSAPFKCPIADPTPCGGCFRCDSAEMMEAVAMQQYPGCWEALPQSVKREAVRKAAEDAPAAIRGTTAQPHSHHFCRRFKVPCPLHPPPAAMMEEIRKNITQVFDL